MSARARRIFGSVLVGAALAGIGVLWVLEGSPVSLARSAWTRFLSSPEKPSNFATGTQKVSKFGVYEVVLTGDGGVGNPYDTIASVTFIPPSGAANAETVEAFYDGGNTWRARAYVGEAGLWRWTTTSSDPGLDHKSGSFACVATTPRLRGLIEKHSTNSKYWATDDGQTFIGIADTAYNLFGRTWDDGTTPISEATFEQYVTEDEARNVNLIFADMNGGGYRDPHWTNIFSDPGVYNKPNLAAFQATDRRLTWLLNNYPGVYIKLDVLPENSEGTASDAQPDNTFWNRLTQTKKTRLMRTILGRYAAFPEIIWMFTNDTKYGSGYSRNTAMIDEVGTYFKANDPWDHLRATGQNRGQEYYFQNAPWNTYVSLETAAALGADQIATYSALPQHVFNSEDWYEGAGITNPAYFFRWLTWSWILSGGTATYGNANYDSFVPYTTAEWHGLDSVQHIGPYLTEKGIDISRFTDADDLAFESDGATGDRRVQMMRNGTIQYVAYHPNSAEASVRAGLKSSVARMRIDLRDAPGTFKIEWFRASDGITMSGGSVAGGATRDFVAPWVGADVVLYLKSAAPP